jgi:hypothetical protein
MWHPHEKADRAPLGRCCDVLVGNRPIEEERVNIGIFGAGNVGGVLGEGWARTGHRIAYGVPDLDDAKIHPVEAATGDIAEPDETKRMMDDDPGVKAGVFVYEVHACRSFPGDALP